MRFENKIKQICCFLLLLCLTCCSKKEIKTYYDGGGLFKEYNMLDGKYDGKYVEYFENGNVKMISYFDHGINIDSTINYNKDNSINTISYYAKSDSIYI